MDVVPRILTVAGEESCDFIVAGAPSAPTTTASRCVTDAVSATSTRTLSVPAGMRTSVCAIW
jgi:hypothetical protein